MSVTLGFQPERLTVKLSAFGDFSAGLQCEDGNGTPTDWPDGSTIELRFYADDTSRDVGQVWPATITDDLATWHVVVADVIAQVLDADLDFARLFYASPSSPTLEWALGSVRDVK